jgi:hypothetical protein
MTDEFVVGKYHGYGIHEAICGHHTLLFLR